MPRSLSTSVPASTLRRLWSVSRKPARLIGAPPRSAHIPRQDPQRFDVCCPLPELATNWSSPSGLQPVALNEPARGNVIVSRVQEIATPAAACTQHRMQPDPLKKPPVSV